MKKISAEVAVSLALVRQRQSHVGLEGRLPGGERRGALFLDELNSVGLAKGRGGFWHRIPPRYVAIPVPLW